MSRLRLLLTIAVLTLAAGYLALCAGMFFLQRKLLFPRPQKQSWPSSAPGVRIKLQTSGHPVETWYLEGPGGAPVLAYFHGNGEQLADAIPIGRWAHAHGLGFFAVEYPGYGEAGGAPSEASILAAAHKALLHLHTVLRVPAERTVLFGRSLGTGVAAALAAEGAGSKLILLSPYTSIPDVGALAFPLLPVHLLSRDPFNTLALAPKLTLPALLVHGTADEVIPFAIGRRLAAALPSARFVAVHGAGHDDLPDRPEVLEAIATFAASPAQDESLASHG